MLVLSLDKSCQFSRRIDKKRISTEMLDESSVLQREAIIRETIRNRLCSFISSQEPFGRGEEIIEVNVAVVEDFTPDILNVPTAFIIEEAAIRKKAGCEKAVADHLVCPFNQRCCLC
ncbi:hypothetical protein BLNAU_6341 [Blattamonas nauphoetae]|uniref:Uncharacterized protein n=1 Tax=Blattamonas nauphoetae TaxID=2049346 RepID=A0ABQ9Y494_9EUKA|nr:hypothetical protein BLNAU_6341 [Blattamonas nauphoetae]